MELCAVTIPQNVQAYHGKIRDNVPWRYRSLEHCFGYFRRQGPVAVKAERETAALQLGFYLASWGMYRGSGRLLQYDYTVHLPVVDALAEAEFDLLWQREIGASTDDLVLAPLILSVAKRVRAAYKPHVNASDILVSKVLLGTLGCLPACDRFFVDGFTSLGFSFSYLNRIFIERVIVFCTSNLEALQLEQSRIASGGGPRYPLMKLVDMYFWQ